MNVEMEARGFALDTLNKLAHTKKDSDRHDISNELLVDALMRSWADGYATKEKMCTRERENLMDLVKKMRELTREISP